MLNPVLLSKYYEPETCRIVKTSDDNLIFLSHTILSQILPVNLDYFYFQFFPYRKALNRLASQDQILRSTDND